MSSPEDGAPDRRQLEALLELQDLDIRIEQLRHRRANLPEREKLAAVDAALGALWAEREALSAERARLVAQRDGFEKEAFAATARIEAIEARLESAATSFRDQEAMAAEVASLRRRRDEIEDRQLGAMEELEPIELALSALDARRAGLEEERREAQEAFSRAIEAADAAIKAALEERGVLAEAVEPQLRATYEALARRLGGVAVARVVHGTCEGCRLSLSATELDQLRHGGSGRLRCEQCGRILVAVH
jgi:predicted  nucleic acid-binding Zn-ribbon protein